MLLCHRGRGWSKLVCNLANVSVVPGSPFSLLPFLGLLGIKQQEVALQPTHLLSATLLILVAMQLSFLFSFFSIFFNVAKHFLLKTI